jgi:LysM repeat protein
MKKNYGVLLWAISLAMVVSGCASMSHDEIKGAVKKPAPVLEEPTYIFHRVMAGETMSTIAQYYTGKQSMWREVANANPGLSPFDLKKGEIVKVPMAIATVHKEQPTHSTARKTRRTTQKSPEAAAAPSKPLDALEGDDEPVFGPK